MRFDICKKLCDNCAVAFDADLMVCKNCDVARFRYCYINRIESHHLVIGGC